MLHFNLLNDYNHSSVIKFAFCDRLTNINLIKMLIIHVGLVPDIYIYDYLYAKFEKNIHVYYLLI